MIIQCGVWFLGHHWHFDIVSLIEFLSSSSINLFQSIQTSPWSGSGELSWWREALSASSTWSRETSSSVLTETETSVWLPKIFQSSQWSCGSTWSRVTLIPLVFAILFVSLNRPKLLVEFFKSNTRVKSYKFILPFNDHYGSGGHVLPWDHWSLQACLWAWIDPNCRWNFSNQTQQSKVINLCYHVNDHYGSGWHVLHWNYL